MLRSGMLCVGMMCLLSIGNAYAGLETKPIPAERFISLESARNLVGAKKPQVHAPARFLPLGKQQKFIPLRGRANATIPVMLPSELPSAPTGTPKKTNSEMSAAQAQQILSIYTAND